MTDRTFPVPAVYRGGLLGSAATLDEIDLAANTGNEWAVRVRDKENARLLARMLDGDARLPLGACDGDMVLGLYRNGQAWTGSGWENAPPPPSMEVLDPDDVAFVARASAAGHPVFLYPYTPLALISRNGADRAEGVVGAGPKGPEGPEGPMGEADLPPGTKVLAVVDANDRNAVLDTVAVLPGPKTKRRHDGKWVDDPGWVSVLRSVRPPPVVVLTDEQIPDVMGQIDESTRGQAFEPTKKAAKTASGLLARADEMLIEFTLLAAPVGKALSQATPGGRMPKDLMSYWSHGEGAAKIRWGTPGAWTRCHRYLSKYIGPFRAKGACTNIGKRLGGKGVAWDVG